MRNTNNRSDSVKVVCCCAAGNSRSAALEFILKHERGVDAISVGLDIHSEACKNMLFDWADKIMVVATTRELVPERYHYKMVMHNFGDDIWFNGYAPDLLHKARVAANEEGLL